MDSQTNTSNSAHNHPTLSQIEQDALTKAKRRPKAAPAMAPGAVATTDDSEAAPDTHKREAASSALASIGQDVLAKGGTWTSSDAGNTHSTKLNEPVVVTKDANHLESRDSYINRLNEKINMQEEATAKKDPEKPSFDRSSTTSSGTGAIAVAGIGYDETASEKFTTAGKHAKPSAGSDKTMQSKIAGKHAKLSADSDKIVQSKIDEIDRGLAVAMLVEEGSYDGEKDNIHFPSATAYDPDSKPPFHKNRRFRLYGILGLLLLVGIAVAIAVGVTSKSEASEIVNTFSPTVAPTSIAPVLPDDQQIVDRMVQLVGPSANNSSNPSSPSYLAREWILKEDAMNLTYASPTLDQRYLLSVFYFATNFPGRVSPLGCTKPNATEEDSCVFKTRNLQKPVTVPKLVTRLSYNSTRWLTNTSECDWAGLECNDDGNLAAILLPFQDINANIPSELGKLSHLNRLSLIKNGLSGTIPSELGQLNDLLDFELLYNRVLTGTIPEAIWEMSNLQILNLLDAGPLEGTIPSLIGNMKALKGLFLSCFNADVAVMSGTIPSEFALMSDLTNLTMTKCHFNESIPTEFGNLSNLQYIGMPDNKFSGTIPTEIGQLTALVVLNLENNDFEGPIPDELYMLTKLDDLSLKTNSLSSTVSTKVGDLRALKSLRLSYNSLTGAIPTELGLLTAVTNLDVSKNEFDGAVPDEVCIILEPLPFYSLTADCTGGNTSRNPCSCCTICCDRERCLRND